MVYLLLIAGFFMGWSLGTNDGANAFGTAVATGVVKYRTAIIIIAVFVVLGAFLVGAGNLESVSSLAVNNEVTASDADLDKVIDKASSDEMVLKSALKAAIIFACAGLTVFVMSYLKFPVSANQSITGAIIGWGICYADYGNPAVLSGNLAQIGKFASTWIICPVAAAIISFVIVKVASKLLVPKLSSLSHYDSMIKIGYLIAGALASFSIGMNSSANVTALYFGKMTAEGLPTNLLSSAQIAATIGGIAIAIGVLTYSKKVMMTVGTSIAPLTQIEGFLVIIAMAITIFVIGEVMAIPVSTSQAVVGAVVGAGMTKGIKNVNFGVFKNIAIAWVSSPVAAGLVSYVIAIATRSYFG